MSTITWLMLCAAFLPLVATVAAKAGGKGFDNEAPRAWLSAQEGWRARANAAQANLFEGLPFFYAAVLLALFKEADLSWLAGLMLAWVLVRLAYIALYIAGYGVLRTVAWALALALNVAILFA
ncbi:MAPEG family protein [Parapusillimonas sp. JC17]|uniref:MAPEG family protein n=1 Tax=Parapusillimonas sp. JC17 TaxID=3445768 RepID=UPI003FA134FB